MVFLLEGLREGMQGNGGKFKLEHKDNRSKPSLRGAKRRSNPELQQRMDCFVALLLATTS